MSRQLPPHPNLEFLKKQAKDHLAALQREEPGAKLADALHATAREYGFLNWANLKAHVESLARATGPNAFSGTWIARLPHTSTMEFRVAGDAVTITTVVADAPGRDERDVNTLTMDGEDHPVAHGYAVAARWTGSHTMEAIAKQHDQVVGRVAYEVSPDGGTLTVTSHATAHDGYPSSQQSAVFDRL